MLVVGLLVAFVVAIIEFFCYRKSNREATYLVTVRYTLLFSCFWQASVMPKLLLLCRRATIIFARIRTILSTAAQGTLSNNCRSFPLVFQIFICRVQSRSDTMPNCIFTTVNRFRDKVFYSRYYSSSESCHVIDRLSLNGFIDCCRV